MSQTFDLSTGELAVGDPTMGLARYALGLPAGAYRLGRRAFRRTIDSGPEAVIQLDGSCVFALDAAHLEEFEKWYHRVGNECAYMVLTLAERLPEFEAAAGARVGFYWEDEVAGRNREGEYVLDPAGVLTAAEPSTAP